MLQGGAKDKCGKESGLFIVDACGKPIGQQDGCRAENRRGKARRKFIETEKRKRKNEFPIEENGFVVPIFSVNLRGHPIARLHHLPRGECIIRFGRIGDGDDVVRRQVANDR